MREMSNATSGVAKDVSRRAFLKFGGAAGLTVALGGSLATLTGCHSELADNIIKGQRTVTDHAGREVVIPTVDKLERIYYTSALAEIYVFSLAPELRGGTSINYTSEELKYLPADTADLLYMGSLSGGGEIDREMLMEEDIQLVFSISGTELTAANISEAEDLQEATGIPTLVVDGSFTNVMEAYRFVGDVMGITDRAEEIATFCEGIYNDVTSALADVADEDRVSLYYAEGPFGLSSEPDVSQHALTFEVAKARNVAAAIPLATTGYGMSAVSLESVIAWDPEVIVAWDDVIRGGADELIRTDPDWSNIRAVKNGRLYHAQRALCLVRPPAGGQSLLRHPVGGQHALPRPLPQGHGGSNQGVLQHALLGGHHR